MSKDYVQLEDIKSALEKTLDNEKLIQTILGLLSTSTVSVDEAAPVTEESSSDTPEEGDTESEPKPKQQYVILVSDPNGQIKSDLTGWVLQYPEDEDCREIIKGIRSGAYNFNASKKGRKYPVSSIGQTISGLGSKWLKPYGVKVKTKEAVYVVVTDNSIPRS